MAAKIGSAGHHSSFSCGGTVAKMRDRPHAEQSRPALQALELPNGFDMRFALAVDTEGQPAAFYWILAPDDPAASTPDDWSELRDRLHDLVVFQQFGVWPYIGFRHHLEQESLDQASAGRSRRISSLRRPASPAESPRSHAKRV